MKDNAYTASVLVMLVTMIGVVIMFIYGMDHSIVFSFTLGAGLIAAGFSQWLDDLRPSRIGSCFFWILGTVNFYIGFTRI